MMSEIMTPSRTTTIRIDVCVFFVLCCVMTSTPCLFAKDAAIRVNTRKMSSWHIDRMLFGRFCEHHGGTIYPGIDEQYIVNTSFEKYYRKGKDSPTPLKDMNPWLVFRDVKATDGVAYPWEPFGDNKSTSFELAPDALNSQTSQRIIKKAQQGLAGVKQRLALPDYRIGQYKLKMYAKSPDTVKKFDVQLKGYQSEKVFSKVTFELSNQWKSYIAMLDLKRLRSNIKHNDRQGIYELVISFEDKGSVLIDEATLYPADAVEGRWNPETIANLKEAGVTVIRWPGGNFASGYHWMDGVGPIEKRPTRPNLAWGGLENNHVGTDDFLHFCKLADLTPLICIAFGTCSAQEAADWVEYCNGSVDTRYGRLRAQNGHPEPYRVKLWQIGNEVYGSYQIGHTNAEDYATRYLDYFHAMKKVDPTIKMMAMGKDPGYHKDDNNAWNKMLFKIIGNKMDYLDIHRYVRGIRKANELRKWNLIRLSEIYIAFSTQYDKVIDSIRQLTDIYGVPNVKLAVTEWAEYPSLLNPKLPHAFSQANAVFYAGMMNSFIRNGRFVKVSCSHDLSVFTSTKAPWNIPVLPRSRIARMYSEVSADRLLEIEVDCDTFDIPRKIPQMMRLKNIPYLDAVALSTENRNQIVVFIVNRSLTSDYNVNLELIGITAGRNANIALFSALDDPLVPQTWKNRVTYAIKLQKSRLNNGRMNINVPICSVTKIVLNK